MPQSKKQEGLDCATRITMRQVELEVGESTIVDHVGNGWVQTFDATFNGGGRPSFLLRFATVEPLNDEELRSYRAEQARVAAEAQEA